jgi:hypothetical protein
MAKEAKMAVRISFMDSIGVVGCWFGGYLLATAQFTYTDNRASPAEIIQNL